MRKGDVWNRTKIEMEDGCEGREREKVFLCIRDEDLCASLKESV